MASAEEHARREAVARMLAGQPTAKVAADLGRSDRWVRKWVARFDPSETGGAADRSRTPATVANRTPAELERVVLAVRQRLMDDPWAQVGAAAIAWELTKLGLEPPAVWTIDRILRRAGVAKRRARGRYVPKGTPYPAGRAVVQPGAHQEIDLVGPRYLAGATAFHALNAIDVGRRRCGIEILASKEERAVAEGLVRLWRRLGVPKVAQFDNGQTLQGRGRVLALPVRLCLALGVRVRFIPFAEPWRNGVVEHFNDVFDKRFLSHRAVPRAGPPGPAGAGLRGLPQRPPPLLGPAWCNPGRVGGTLAVDAAPARPHLHATHGPAQAGADRLHPADPLRPAAQDPRGQAPSARDTGPSLRHRHPARAPRATRRHLRGPVAHGGSLHPQAVTGTMPCCLRCPASERGAAINPRWTTLNDVLLCMT